MTPPSHRKITELNFSFRHTALGLFRNDELAIILLMTPFSRLTQCVVTTERSTLGPDVPGSTSLAPTGKEINRHYYVTKFGGNAHWAET